MEILDEKKEKIKKTYNFSKNKKNLFRKLFSG